MFIIKENLLYGEDYLMHTASESALQSFELLTEENTESISNLNKQLEDKYGVVKRMDCILPVYEVVCLNAGVWHCERCGITVFQHNGSADDFLQFTVKNSEDDVMGALCRYTVSDTVQIMNLLDNGGCPVCDGWDDGIGHTCSPHGWGKTKFLFKNCKLISKLKNK